VVENSEYLDTQREGGRFDCGQVQCPESCVVQTCVTRFSFSMSPFKNGLYDMELFLTASKSVLKFL
jgi:hypothetical protein